MHSFFAEALDELRWLMGRPRPLTEADNVKLTPQEIHDFGLCNKARLHYECHGRDNYGECG
jgi:hypothetical protein